MKVLVIGGTNFIGPHVVRQLIERGHEVAVFHRGETKAKLLTYLNNTCHNIDCQS